MMYIVICQMCGAQTEADKKFCPACGAPVKPFNSTNSQNSQPTGNHVPKEEAASRLFTHLQHKKNETNYHNNALEESKSVTQEAVTVSEKRERPKTFKQKPLGVIQSATPSTHKGTTLSKEVKEQLIEFLRGLNRLDRMLEASAVVKKDGSLLASAHSSRVKPEMMATISSTLFGIAQDSIRAISGGKMRIVTITAEQSVLMLKPINEDTVLLLVTSPNSNIGLISMNSELVAQNIANFLLKLT